MRKKNDGSKKTAKKDFPKNKYYLILGLSVIIVILLFVFLVKSMFDNFKPSYYTIKSRKSNIEEKNNAAQSKDANYDVVGWLRVQGTKIDYPVVSGKDNSFDQPVQSTAYGWLNSIGDPNYHNVLFIFGHNIMNLGSRPFVSDDSFERFEELLAFLDYDFAEKNLYFQYSMNGEDYLYKIFSVGVFEPSNLSGLPEGDYSEEELNNYIKMLKDKSIYNYDVNVTSNDDVISLVTCTGLFSSDLNYNDIVISGKRVLDNESKKTYSISKTSNYDDVKKEMKGDSDNEE